MAIIKVDPQDRYPRVYWPEELKRFGFVGEVEVISDSATGTIIHPEAAPEQVIKSLENRIRDMQLRITSSKRIEFRPLEEQTATKVPVEKAPVAEWENIQCPYPDCRAPLMWHVNWEQATCSRCGRPIVRNKI